MPSISTVFEAYIHAQKVKYVTRESKQLIYRGEISKAKFDTCDTIGREVRFGRGG